MEAWVDTGVGVAVGGVPVGVAVEVGVAVAVTVGVEIGVAVELLIMNVSKQVFVFGALVWHVPLASGNGARFEPSE